MNDRSVPQCLCLKTRVGVSSDLTGLASMEGSLSSPLPSACLSSMVLKALQINVDDGLLLVLLSTQSEAAGMGSVAAGMGLVAELKQKEKPSGVLLLDACVFENASLSEFGSHRPRQHESPLPPSRPPACQVRV